MIKKTLEELKVIISAETSKFSNALKNATNEAKTSASSIESSTGRISRAVSGIKSMVAKVAAGFGLYKLGKEAIEVASNITEVQNVVDTAFGDMAWKAERFAKNSIQQFGMSELSAKKTASTYMAMASGMGLGQEKASDMAITLAGLSGDVASFYNISQELADIKLKSVFTGETETLKDLGIVMTQTNLQSYALSQGISKNVSDMSQAELTTLRYNFVLNQLSMAQGDFAKTSGTWANQVRILQEQFKQLLGIIGNGLIVALTPVIQVINMIIGKLITLANVIAGVFGKLFGKKSGAKQASAGFTAAGDSAKKATASTGGLNKALKGTEGQAKKTAKALGSLASFDEINTISASDSSGSGGSGGSGAGGVGGGGYDIGSIDWDNAFGEPDTSGVDKAVDKVLKKLNSIKDWLKQNKPIILSLIAGIVAGFLAFETIKNWENITLAISTIKLALKELLETFIALYNYPNLVSLAFTGMSATMLVVVALIASVTASLVYLYQTSDSFRQLVNDSISELTGILDNFYKSILVPIFYFLLDLFNTIIVPIAMFLAKTFVKAVEAVFTIALSLWKNVLAPLANFLVSVLSIALSGILEVWNTWKPGIQAIGDAINWVWDNVLSPLVDFIVGSFSDTFKSWGDLINELIPNVIEMFQGLTDFFVGVFTGDEKRCWEGIRKIFEGFANFLKVGFTNDWTKAFGLLGVPLNAFCSTVTAIWNTIKGVLSGIIDFVGGVFTGNWARAWNGVKNIFSNIVSGFAGIFKAPINAIISGINSFIGGLNKIKIPNWVPGIGGKGFNISKIPKLAEGAVVSKATPAIFGEAGTEAVIPLQRNTKGLDLIAQKISERLPQGDGGNGGTYVINLVLENGKALARMVIDNIKDYEVQTGKPAFDY